MSNLQSADANGNVCFGEGFTESTCYNALQKLVARHASLAANPEIRNLISKGADLKVEDVVNIFPNLFLHGDLTVSAVGCLRSHMVSIMNNLVEILKQLYSIGKRTDDVHDKVDAEQLVQEKWHRGNCWSLKLHEFVTIALSRTVELLPFLLRHTLRYFSFAPPPFERLLQCFSSSEITEKDALHLLDVVRASYRLLHVDSGSFSELWDWSPLLELLQWPGDLSNSAISLDLIFDVRWSALQALSIVLKMSDEETRELGNSLCGLTEEHYFTCLLRWEEFCQDVAVEKASWYLEHNELGTKDFLNSFSSSDGAVAIMRNPGSNASSLVSYMQSFGIALGQGKGVDTSRSFVMTSNMKKIFQAVVVAISQGNPILLEGQTGVGKTKLINMLAQTTGNSDVLFIHLDDQMDSKTLVGSYVCTEIPGEFKWQPGSLTQAVLRGLWVVFEEIDKAPSDVLSVISPLLEDRKLHIPGRAEAINASEGFQLFATVTKNHDISRQSSSGWDAFNSLWRKIVIDSPTETDLIEIVNGCYPQLMPVASKMIETLNVMNRLPRGTTGTFGSENAVNSWQMFSTRDLVKWCKRINDVNLCQDSNWLSTFIGERIFYEAVDIFVASVANKERRKFIMVKIAGLWNLLPSQVEYLEQSHLPTIQEMPYIVQIGRVELPTPLKKSVVKSSRPFTTTGNALRSLERIALCVKNDEPALLVGETGTGKTTLVQHLATMLGAPLIVLNMSQQSDSTDLLGGFKPIDAKSACMPLIEEFMDLFSSTFSSEQNSAFLAKVRQFLDKKKWKQLLKAFHAAVEKVSKIIDDSGSYNREGMAHKRKKALDNRKIEQWKLFSVKLRNVQRQIEASEVSFAFSFVEGALVKAMKNGHWILLDEINLAPPETLQRLTGMLEGGSLCLAEKGDVERVSRHPNFRIFACMNPATDIGKPDLPYITKNRFTEIYIDELLNRQDLQLVVEQYLEGLQPALPISDIVTFYLEARKLSETRLFDGANQKPQYSLRSLARALEYTRAATPIYGFDRALYDGFCMLFLTLLDRESAILMEERISTILIKDKLPVEPIESLKCPPISLSTSKTFSGSVRDYDTDYVKILQYWVARGTTQVSKASLEFRKKYICTKTIQRHLKNLARAVFVRKYPILLQGPTSSGKTSLVEYLANIAGHRFVRINNHEHTDLQEYLGSYIADSSGKMVFQEGVLVEAVRNGHWIVLDELNLAPSEVLEALNRLLDDNRELYVPELQTTVKPHPNFMLFATQNPPGTYGGRKALSRAFRNRFLEIHVDDIPGDELRMILEKRCEIPASYAAKMVEIMNDLQRYRQSSKVFAGKHGFITPRDLFRWADRFRKFGKSYEDLAMDGYRLLAERLREEKEKTVVREILEKHLRVKIDLGAIYLQDVPSWDDIANFSSSSDAMEAVGKVIWTNSLRRLFHLVYRCYEQREPVLLVGETGSGKTTVCQLLSLIVKRNLLIINCHQHTETSDFLGGFRPVRDRSSIAANFQEKIQRVMESKLFSEFSEGKVMSPKIEDASVTLATLRHVIGLLKDGRDKAVQDGLSLLENSEKELALLYRDWQSLFLWRDGPLVEAMRSGHFLLIDEISLADDSVLERLNSVLEPSRLLVLAEKGGSILEELTADPNFFLLATMNPGGDFGKKELSPALRNRFTEIWVPSVPDMDDIRTIVVNRLSCPELLRLADPLLNFWKWFHNMGTGQALTVRDLLSWITFINTTREEIGTKAAFFHGSFLVLLDGLGNGRSNVGTERLRSVCLNYLQQQLNIIDIQGETMTANGDPMELDSETSKSNYMFGIAPFYIYKGSHESDVSAKYALSAPTTSRNVSRILRAMQLNKPILLEGSPGVGKTSLVAALANSSSHNLARINLSEQTDIMDLLGSDLPVEGLQSGFQWSDGILLQALKSGSWVVLDELNLASQSVLEGLNAILDHRGEVYIPELGQTYKCPPSFRVFACQNPSYQGGGRKGLPRSFLNRFTKVFVDELCEDDFLFISSCLHPSIPREFLGKLIKFNSRLYHDTVIACKYGQSGAPWEFNLRDILRCCCLYEDSKGASREQCFLDAVYLQRMRTVQDRYEVLKLFEDVFGIKANISTYPKVKIAPHYFTVGEVTLPRSKVVHANKCRRLLQLLPGFFKSMQTIMHCVQQGWMCILVGPPSSGKTSLIRILAEVTGNKLYEYNLSDSTDTSELLGCFEQFDAFRYFHEVMTYLHDYLLQVCTALLKSQILSIVKDLLASWAEFKKSLKMQSSDTLPYLSTSGGNIENDWLCQPFERLMNISHQLKRVISSSAISVSFSDTDVDKISRILLNLKENSRQNGSSGQFTWFNGGLVKALERGEWVVLENANLCNPTVLDRLNSLLEPGRVITVNERGLVNGQPFVVSAHSKFRIFLTLNPAHGEVSRAMRNRGIEVFLMHPQWSIVPRDVEQQTDSNVIEDLKRILILNGIPISNIIDAMTKTHSVLMEKFSVFGVFLSLRELCHWAQLFLELLRRGAELSWSLCWSWVQTYYRLVDKHQARAVAFHVANQYLSKVVIVDSSNWLVNCLTMPGGWPTPLLLSKFIIFSKEAVVERDCMYLKHMGSQYASSKLEVEWKTSMHAHGKGKMFAHDPKSNMRVASFIPSYILSYLLFPGSQTLYDPKNVDLPPFDHFVVENMLYYAGEWIIQQATLEDISLRLQWLEWHAQKLTPFCPILDKFLTIMKKAMDHPVQKCLFSLLRNKSNLQSLPCFSMNLLQLDCDNANILERNKFKQLISSFLLLRQSIRQWMIEDDVSLGKPVSSGCSALTSECTKWFHSILKVLRELENKLLLMSINLIDDRSFSGLFKSLQECHQELWKAVKKQSENLDIFIICWHRLKKSVSRLVMYGEANKILAEVLQSFIHASRNLDEAISSHAVSAKPWLWKYAGHPLLPSTSELFYKRQQILQMCMKMLPDASFQHILCYAGNDAEVEKAVCTNFHFRHIVVQGTSIALSMDVEITGTQADKAIFECDDILKMLLERYEAEKSLLANSCVGKPSEFQTHQVHERLNSTYILSAKSLDDMFSLESFCFSTTQSLWVKILILLEHKGLCMDLIMLRSFSEKLLPYMKSHCQASLSQFLKRSISFGLKSTSRSPLDFIPHQKLLWVIDADSSNGINDIKYSSCIHDMWYEWHSALWKFQVNYGKNEFVGNVAPESPFLLFTAIQTITAIQILNEPLPPVKDHQSKLHQLKVASAHLLKHYIFNSDIYQSLSSSVTALFKQIILIHCKSLEEKDVDSVRQFLNSICQSTSMTCSDGTLLLDQLVLLLKQSDHEIFRNAIGSFVHPFFEAIQSSKYRSSDEPGLLYNMAHCWLLLGGLRLNLLVGSYGIDPVMKHSLKHSQLLDKLQQVELQMKVWQESEKVTLGHSCQSNAEDMLYDPKTLKDEVEYQGRKVVYRPEPSKFRAFQSECADFVHSVDGCLKLLNFVNRLQVTVPDTHLCTSEVQNWQEIASSFINRLSEEYASFRDLAQPIQLAIYELKFGLSLATQAYLEDHVSVMTGASDGKEIMTLVCSLMAFPTGSERDCNAGKYFTEESLLNEKLISCLFAMLTSEDCRKEVILYQLKMEILCFCFVSTGNKILQSRSLDNSSMQILDKIFSVLSNLWMEMKEQVKGKAVLEAQSFKFKARNFEIEDELEINDSTFRKLLINDIWELNSHGDALEEHSEKNEASVMLAGDINIESVWGSVEKIVLHNIVKMQIRLFRNTDFLRYSGGVKVTDDDRLNAFSLGYDIGMKFIQETRHILASMADEKIMSGHLLRVCVEHKKLSEPACSNFNIYKDPNTSEVALMVGPLKRLEDKVKHLLSLWEDNALLQEILKIIATVLDIPLDAPFMKAVIGVQFVICRSVSWNENASEKFSLSDELSPLYSLLKRWRKIEFECWPTLLDSIEQQHELNADRLWFALYSVLFRKIPDNNEEEIKSTIHSVEDFMQTATIGEFKRRLELLRVFHGQLSTQICLKMYTLNLPRNLLLKLSRITFNVFGYYAQFLPFVIESIKSARKVIEKELNDYSELCKWDKNDYYSIEVSKNTHQKLQKFIRKYNDILVQPVIELLNKQVGSMTAGNFEERLKKYEEAHVTHRDAQKDFHPYSFNQLRMMEDIASQIDSDFKEACNHDILVISDKLQKYIFESIFAKEALDLRQEGCKLLQNSLTNMAYRAHDLRKDDVKRFVKEKIFHDILQELKSIGLSHHKSAVPKEYRDPSSWFLEPAFGVSHIDLEELHGTNEMSSTEAFSCSKYEPRYQGNVGCWKLANEYYFKNMALMQRLQEISHHFNKDLKLKDVENSMSFLKHLFYLQQKQRCTAYNFLSRLEKLSEVVFSLKDSVTVCATKKSLVSHHQHYISKWIKELKHYVDSLFNAFADTSLLLKSLEGMHKWSSFIEVERVKKYVEKFMPLLETSKVLLDQCHLQSHMATDEQRNQLYPVLISRQMEDLVYHIFSITKEMQSEISYIFEACFQDKCQMPCLIYIANLLEKGAEMSQKFASETHVDVSLNKAKELSKLFVDCYNTSISAIQITVQNLRGLQNQAEAGLLLQECESSFERHMTSFVLENLHNSLSKTVSVAVELFNTNTSDKEEMFGMFLSVESMLRVLVIFVDMIIEAGKSVLIDYVDVHKTVAVMHHFLANIFALLYTDGFMTGEDGAAEDNNSKIEDSSGTGMGKGEGVKDVSDQIEDEDQLLGNSDQANEEASPSQTLSRQPDKGIEMEQDFFTNDIVSLSEDSSDEIMDGDDEMNLDSEMGKTSNDEEIVDEQLWNKNEDQMTENTTEKYESGASVQDSNQDSMELRAKHDAECDDMDTQEKNDEKSSSQNVSSLEEQQPEVNNETDNLEPIMDKENAYTDPTGTQPEADEEFQLPEDMDVEEPSESQMDVEVKQCTDQDEENNETDEVTDKDHETNDIEMDSVEPSGPLEEELAQDKETQKQEMETESTEVAKQSVMPQESSDMNALTAKSDHPNCTISEADNQNTSGSKGVDGFISDLQNDDDRGNDQNEQQGTSPSIFGEAASQSLISDVSNETGYGKSSEQKLSSCANENQTFERMDANPLRSMGDVLKEWKERVKLLDVASEDEKEIETVGKFEDNMETDKGDEFQYVSEKQKGNSQALGAATVDQLKADLNVNRVNTVDRHEDNSEILPLPDPQNDSILEDKYVSDNDFHNIEKKTKFNKQIRETPNDALFPAQEVESKIKKEHLENQIDRIESFVSLRRQHDRQIDTYDMDNNDVWTEEDIKKLRREVQMLLNIDCCSEHASKVWIKFEQLTTRLSHDLAEQLRLIMEPTLASKLQGDYQTGKRINMKKIIPYIASHFRKDKIWLRRTKPNRREYQVVLAIDDSRSMSENNCGHMALEALITICRALSQLEVGQMAIASFGKKGNIQMLHDFDQPFTSEAGLKIISKFSFKQENTIADEPVVDLLKYLVALLDHVAMSSRGRSGQVEIQQLVLIIADGRFHEKENLKRCVRDALSRKQLLAFIVLDNSEESILDVQSVSFTERGPQFSKYIDSFPFPYYIILKDIEALPRTLADLLRQWFELMRY